MTNSQPAMSSQLTEDIAIAALRDFFRGKPFVVFGTGMSCALDLRFGMAELEKELQDNVVPDQGATEQVTQWAEVTKSLKMGNSLENALDNVTDPSLLESILNATAEFISLIDREYGLLISNGEVVWPARRLFELIVNTLPPGDPVLHVLTPNYDTLFEHACDSVNMRFTNGFMGGIACRLDWSSADLSLRVPQKVVQRGRLRTSYRQLNHIRLYKVHGSLSYFLHRDSLVENHSWMWDAPGFSHRIMITPGISKHQRLQNYRQELLQQADSEIEKSIRFLFLGYGFNDAHLETYIKHKLVSQACLALIVTRDSNPRIESLLEQAENLWLVCKAESAESDGSRILNRRYAGWLELPTRKLWDIDTFTTEILGG